MTNMLRWIERTALGELYVVELHPEGRRTRSMRRDAIRRNYPGLVEEFEARELAQRELVT